MAEPTPGHQRGKQGSPYIVTTLSGKQWFGWCPDCIKLGRRKKSAGKLKHPYHLDIAWRTNLVNTEDAAAELLRQHQLSERHVDSLRSIAMAESVARSLRS